MPTKTGGFRGQRNTVISDAARRRSIEVRQRAALERKIETAKALLTENGYTVQPSQS